ncbi:hypothetical protein [Solidesulfovibrio fructosivorans]|uniref:hypothetical protein n=1 Tax=Solidesulfovibrio fructosivorans TaxID=878 RepID=UPI0011805969|nr:hypothetical protein [Solidesulfovibrio fructosivorans]
MQRWFGLWRAISHSFDAPKIAFLQIASNFGHNDIRDNAMRQGQRPARPAKEKEDDKKEGNVVFFETQEGCGRNNGGQTRGMQPTPRTRLHTAPRRIKTEARH